ncbi:hypothetical protein ACK8GE_08520 [Micromonosporaceae bacterium DT194]|uniref:hypothetical protein n=1 Tax=Melissospora conviva TaxID=3388432 RepID=UPI003C162859
MTLVARIVYLVVLAGLLVLGIVSDPPFWTGAAIGVAAMTPVVLIDFLAARSRRGRRESLAAQNR